MSISRSGVSIRTPHRLLKSGLAVGVLQVASPFVLHARAADVVKIGLDNPLTGPFAGLGKNELIGCQLAVEQINGEGRHSWAQRRGWSWRITPAATRGNGGAVLKARKLI